MNKLMILGNLTRDCQSKTLNGGSSVTEFGIASNHRYTTKAGEKKEEVCFLDCTAWGKTGEIIAQYFSKGKPIILEGRLVYQTWEDKQGGKRSKHVLNVDSFHFLPRNSGGGDGDDSQPPQRQSRGPTQRPPSEQPVGAPFGDEQQFDEADIPFRAMQPERQPV